MPGRMPVDISGVETGDGRKVCSNNDVHQTIVGQGLRDSDSFLLFHLPVDFQDLQLHIAPSAKVKGGEALNLGGVNAKRIPNLSGNVCQDISPPLPVIPPRFGSVTCQC